MRIAALTRCSFVDYPGKLAATVFAPGCNFRCPFCHNRGLLGQAPPGEPVSARSVLDFLSQRIGMLDGLVITGGEPTLQTGLAYFCRLVRRMGFAVKLDTNGSNPDVLARLIDRGWVDYVAMDVKAPLRRYAELAGGPVNMDAIAESIGLLQAGRVDGEFRTTVAPGLAAEDLAAIADRIAGAPRYALQPFRTHGDPALEALGPAMDTDALCRLAPLLTDRVGEVRVRGLGQEVRFAGGQAAAEPAPVPAAPKADKLAATPGGYPVAGPERRRA